MPHTYRAVLSFTLSADSAEDAELAVAALIEWAEARGFNLEDSSTTSA